jgi:hypothetical protein
MDESTLVCDHTITPYENVVCNRLPKYFDLEYVRNNLFRLSINVWMNESDVVVASDHVSEGRQSFLYPLNGNSIWDSIPKMLQLLIRSRRRDEEAVTIT